MKRPRSLTLLVSTLIGSTACALATDNWTAHLTVDNQYSLYNGTGNSLNFVGQDTDWTVSDTWNFSNQNANDYLFVTTASDRAVAQGFLGDFQNTTQNYDFRTGGANWEVFPAGAHLLALYGMGGAWPANTLPTTAQTAAAIQYADNNGLWIPTSEMTNWDNRVAGNVTVWNHRPGIDARSEWIWHLKAGLGSNPFQPGQNHDEFLIFRVQGTPEPATATLLVLGALALRRRRRA